MDFVLSELAFTTKLSWNSYEFINIYVGKTDRQTTHGS